MSPIVLSVVVFSAGAVVWVGLHYRPRRITSTLWRVVMFLVRAAAGFATILAAARILRLYLVPATNWPIWPIALIAALAVEAVVELYASERRTVPRKTSLVLLALRITLVLLVVAMLAQPVRSLDLVETARRTVAICLDESASMRVPDTQLGPSEKVRLAEMLLVKSVEPIEGILRPVRLELSRRRLGAVRRELAALGDSLICLDEAGLDVRRKWLNRRQEEVRKLLSGARDDVERQIKALENALNSGLDISESARTALLDAKARLAGRVRDRLTEALKTAAPGGEADLARQPARLLEPVRRAATALAELETSLAALARTLDEAFYASLRPEQKARVDAAAGLSRLALARKVLLSRGESELSLLGRLGRDYDLKFYTFAARPNEADPGEWLDANSSGAGAAAATAPTSQPAEQQQTDIAAALRKVVTDAKDSRLAGIIVLSDGLHNAPDRPEPVARQLGLRQVPICSIVFGGDRPPTDAAVLSLEAPETVFAGDKMYITAELKLDGLAGKSARVTLLSGGKQVDFKTVSVPSGSFRTRVQLADEPGETGLRQYRVQVQSFEGEVFSGNNESSLAVSVTDERTKLLLVEGRPRWEFRYLKNLFAGRDRTVRLQYVLFEPDRIEGSPPRAAIAASASRPPDKIEAAMLPKDEAEWMKFDVVILGDVAPLHLRRRDIEALRKFVSDCGGTLVVIAGPWYMPHAFASTPLAELLPAAFKPADHQQAPRRQVEPAFRIALTAEGRQSVIMRQKIDPQENVDLWAGLPAVYWRYPILNARAGATVLAYAMPPKPPEFLRPGMEGGKPSAETLRKHEHRRRRFERRRALVLAQQVGLGRVMFLATDRTWRMRYRVGDTHHHKFWGQVLRWATAGKLPAGTDFVKIGTDRSRYAPHGNIQAQARIVRPDLTPVVSEEVAVNVFAGRRLVLRRKLQYVPDSAGLYRGELGELPGGVYRIELDAPPAQEILAAQNVEKVETFFSVDPAAPAEQAELSRDLGLPGRLAELSGGVVLEPHQARQVVASLAPSLLKRHQRRQILLWNSWPLLVVLIGIATAEWLLRKKAGLA